MCARTCIPIHNALTEAVCCCFPRNTVFTTFSLYDVGHQDIEVYPCIKFCLSQCLPLSHTYAIKNVLAKTVFLWFSKKYRVYNLTMTMFVTSQSFISLPSFMFVSAAVSEIHDLNQNKKENNLQNGYFQFTTFPRHITDPFFKPFLHTKLAESLVHHKLKVTTGISLRTHITLYSQYYRS